MLKLPVYNLEGEKVGETELNPKIFSEKFRPALIWQVLTSMQANRHFPWAHTKTRGEVRGGGAKPWRQKGTGRARHGSIRSPIWRGGGVTFGPRKEKNYSKKIPKKMRRKALFSALSQKLKDGEIKIVDQWQLPEIKTKRMAEILDKLLNLKKREKKKDALIVLAEKNEKVRRSSSNLLKTKTILADSLNVEDVLKYKNLLLEKRALPIIEKTFLK